jgi:hypothetical protein
LKLAAKIADPQFGAPSRRPLAHRLARGIVRFMDGDRPRYQSRLESLHEVVEILGPAWDRETDPAAQAALAHALEVAHRRLHERLKPDETAEGRAFALARQRDPAANHNAQSIVIHSLHREGAPLLDQPAPAAQRKAIARLQPTTAAPIDGALALENPE